MGIADSSESAWAEGLLDEQRKAASFDGKNARMLAGPGTGKTLTLKARVAFLVLERNVEPEHILALTFTRAAAGELRGRIEKALEGKVVGRPRVATLHAFALRTLLRNSELLDALPQPLRIADDWEERNIIHEDLKRITATDIRTVRNHFQALSADWDTLRADESTPNPLRADAGFVGAWLQHRSIYGYTLRAELVYQLKRALEQHGGLKFDEDIEHLLVDEYQDLNACDLSVIRSIAAKGMSIYAAGDDDQSIYGFRHANPEGIRQFDKDHAPCEDLALGTCMRCDEAIMDLARFVADLDPVRLRKPWNPREMAGTGEVSLLRFDNGEEEAEGIASVCKYLITEQKIAPDDILILIRSDRNGAFSKPLAAKMEEAGVPFSLNTEPSSPLDTPVGRTLLSLIRLGVYDQDSLAWRTLLTVRKNGVGEKTIAELNEQARNTGATFADVVRANVSKAEGALSKEVTSLEELLVRVKAFMGEPGAKFPPEEIQAAVTNLGQSLAATNGTDGDEAIAHLVAVAAASEATSFDELLSTVSMTGLTPEQELTAGAVNVLTMHKAKGLSASAVIVMACEDEYLPGRQQTADREADERRLLYVSLTRAKKHLYVTYAQKRFGPQQHTGRDSGKHKRTLTRYLRYAPLHPIPATDFFSELGKV